MTAEATDETRREFRVKAGLMPVVLDDEGREVPGAMQEGQEAIDPNLWVAAL